MSDLGQLDREIGEAEGFVTGLLRQSIFTADPRERGHLMEELLTAQRRLFEIKKKRDVTASRPLVDDNAASPRTAEPGVSRPTVFVSYSRRDRRWFDKLEAHLLPLIRDRRVDAWDDGRTESGSLWRSELERALSEARVAVPLVSAAYLASDWVFEAEMPLLVENARTRGLIVLPVIVGHCHSGFTRSPLSQFPAFNSPTSPLSAKSPIEQENVLSGVVRTALKYLGQ